MSCLTFNWNDTAIASGSVNGDILLHNVMTGQASDALRLSKTQVFITMTVNTQFTSEYIVVVHVVVLNMLLDC